MTVLIDADGCPVVDITVKAAKQAGINCVILCDTSHVFDKPGVKTITVPRGTDSVDFVLVNMINKGDVVVTQDCGLSAMSLSRGAVAVNQDGMLYTDDNIDALLLQRHTTKRIRMAGTSLRFALGGRVKSPAKRTTEQDIMFEKTLRELLST
jgi:hypothetical protein